MAEDSFDTIMGLPVIFSEHLTVPETYERRRTLRERWLTWPWRPWVKMRVAVRQLPDRQVYRLGGKYIVHPAIWPEIKAGLFGVEPQP